jgi:hypothetical protein
MKSLWLCLALSLGPANLLTSRAAGKEVSEVSLPYTYLDFACNPETGDLAAINPTTSTVTLFKESMLSGGEELNGTPVKVGNVPFAIAYKKYQNRGTFVVVCQNDSNFYLLDAKDLTLLRKIPLASSGVQCVAVSRDSNDPYVYYCYRREDKSSMGRVNLAKLTDEGVVHDDCYDCALSASGKLLYRRGSRTPFECLRLVEGGGSDGKPRFDRIYDHNNIASYVADPFDFYTAAGADVRTADFRKKVATVAFNVTGFATHRALIFGIKDQELMFASFNTFRTAARVTLPSGLKLPGSRDNADENAINYPSGDGRRLAPLRTATFVDATRDRIVVARGSGAAVVSLAELKLPAEPFLLVTLDGPPAFTVGKQGKIKLMKADPSLKLDVTASPPGLKLTGDTIEWTPTLEEVGQRSLSVNLSHGDISTTQVIPLEIAYPSARLPFLASNMAVSSDEKWAVCWQQPLERLAGHRETAADPFTHLAVVNLSTLQIVAEARLPFQVVAGATDGKQVFVSQFGSDQLTYFAMAEPTNQKSLAVPGDISSLHIVAGKLFVGLKGDGIACFTIPELKVDTSLSQTVRSDPRTVELDIQHQRPSVSRVREGWLCDTMLYDAELKTPQLLLAAPGFTLPVLPDSRRSEALLTSWGKLPQTIRQGNSPYSFSPPSVVVHDAPALITATAAVELKTPVSMYNRASEQSLKLTVVDLAAGVHHETFNLAIREVAQVPGEVGVQAVVIRPLSGGAAVLYGDNVYRFSLPKSLLEKLPTPSVFEPKQSTFVIDLKKPTKLTHVILGAKAPLQATLTTKRAEISIDPEAATITVDGPKLLASAMQRFIEAPLPIRVPENPIATNQLFERVTGRKPNGWLNVLPIGLKVVDADSKTAELSYVVFLEMPQHEIQKIQQERQAEAAKRAAEMEKTRAELAEQGLAKGRGGPGAPAGDSEQRLRQIEERLRLLEAKLDLLTKLLGEKVKNEK